MTKYLPGYQTLEEIPLQSTLKEALRRVLELRPGKVLEPALSRVFIPFVRTPLDDIRVVIINDIPRQKSSGLAFGTTTYTDISAKVADRLIRDFGEENFLDMPLGDPVEYQFDQTLESWAKQGILLLNSSLTAAQEPIESHLEIWQEFLGRLLEGISSVRTGIVFLFMGEEAAIYGPRIKGTFNYILKAEHPSIAVKENRPWECKEFQVINQILKGIYNEEIRWLK